MNRRTLGLSLFLVFAPAAACARPSTSDRAESGAPTVPVGSDASTAETSSRDGGSMGPGPERPPAATLTKVVDKAERRAALAKLAPEALALTRGRVDQAVGDRPDVWIWKPNTEVEIVIASGCNATAHLAAGDYKDKCGVLIEGSKRYFEAWGTVAQLEEGGRLRLRGADAKGSFTRDVTFSEGHVEVGERAARK